MKDKGNYHVILFRSVSHALRSEKILNRENIPFKLIPVPKSISPDCGVCIRFVPENMEKILTAISGSVEYSEIRQLS